MTRVNDVVDKVYVRNLTRRPDRIEQIVPELARVGIKWERFTADDHLDRNESPRYTNAMNLKSMLYITRANRWKSVLLLDDDTYFCKDFEQKFDEFWQQVPDDWDSVSLSSIFRNDIADQEFVAPLVIRSYESWGGHATIVNAKAYVAYINTIKGDRWVDVELAELYPHINHYVAYPALAGQREGYSDLQQSYRLNDYYGVDKHEDDRKAGE